MSPATFSNSLPAVIRETLIPQQLDIDLHIRLRR